MGLDIAERALNTGRQWSPNAGPSRSTNLEAQEN